MTIVSKRVVYWKGTLKLYFTNLPPFIFRLSQTPRGFGKSQSKIPQTRFTIFMEILRGVDTLIFEEPGRNFFHNVSNVFVPYIFVIYIVISLRFNPKLWVPSMYCEPYSTLKRQEVKWVDIVPPILGGGSHHLF